VSFFSWVSSDCAYRTEDVAWQFCRCSAHWLGNRAARFTEDVTVGASKVGDGLRALLSASKTVSIEGELRYQACDKTIGYPPTSVPVKWELQIQPLDLKRSPKAIQHQWILGLMELGSTNALEGRRP